MRNVCASVTQNPRIPLTEDTCTNTGVKPLVLVKNSTHLYVDWSKAFANNCFNRLNKITSVEIQQQLSNNTMINTNVTVEIASKHIIFKTDVCMFHKIEIKLTYTNMKTQQEIRVFSSPAYYNQDYTIENLFAGLLKDKVFDKICRKDLGGYFLPDPPKEIQHCINYSLEIERESKVWKFEITNPRGPGQIPVEVQLDSDLNCTSSQVPQTADSKRQFERARQAVIIGSSVSLVIVFVSAVMIYRKCCKKTDEAQADENPMYEGAADYEYDNVDNSSEVTDTIMGRETTDTTMRREVRAEVVDRNSIYGEEVEGWVGALTSDNNPDYD